MFKYTYSFSAVLAQLQKRIAEPAPGLVQLLTGPRQTGKTTILLNIKERIKKSAVYKTAAFM